MTTFVRVLAPLEEFLNGARPLNTLKQISKSEKEAIDHIMAPQSLKKAARSQNRHRANVISKYAGRSEFNKK